MSGGSSWIITIQKNKADALKFKLVESQYEKKEYQHFLLYDKELFMKFNVQDNFIDSTFKTCPAVKEVCQFMTVIEKYDEEIVSTY